MSNFEGAPHSPPPSFGEVPPDQRTTAMLAHLLGILTGFIGCLVIWLVNKDNPEKAFVTDQAKEALNFQITLTLAMVISMFLVLIVIGAFLLPLLIVANLVLCILAGIKANEGVLYRYPVTLRLIK